MDVNERWRRASESADRFSPFRRRRPIFVGLVTALVALISLAVFVSVAGLDIRQFWMAALVSITAMMFAGSCFTLLNNHKAKLSYGAEYRRLNKINPASDQRSRRRLCLPKIISERNGGVPVTGGQNAPRPILSQSHKSDISHRATVDGGGPSGAVAADPPLGNTDAPAGGASGTAASLAGGLPGSTTTRVPTRTR